MPEETVDYKALITDRARGEVKDFITRYWVVIAGKDDTFDGQDKKNLDDYADPLMKKGEIKIGDKTFKLSEFQQKAKALNIPEIPGLGSIEDITKKIPTEEEIEALAAAAKRGEEKTKTSMFSLEGIGQLFAALMEYIGDFFSWLFNPSQNKFPGAFTDYMKAAAAPQAGDNIAEEISKLNNIDAGIRQKVIDGVYEVTDHMANNRGAAPDPAKRPEVVPLKEGELKAEFVDELVSTKVREAFNTPDANGKTGRDLLKEGKSWFGFGGLNDVQVNEVIAATERVLSKAVMDKDLPQNPAEAKKHLQQKLNAELDVLAEKYAWYGSKKVKESWSPARFSSVDQAEIISKEIIGRLDDKNVNMLITANSVFNNRSTINPLKSLDKDNNRWLTANELGDKNEDSKVNGDELSAIKNFTPEEKVAFDEMLKKAGQKAVKQDSNGQVTEIDFTALATIPGKPSGLQIG